MPDPVIPEIEEKVGLLYFWDTWERSRCVPRRDGQSVECAACGRDFIVSSNIQTLSATRFSRWVRDSVRKSAKAGGPMLPRSLARVRFAVCLLCAERLS